VNAVRNRLFLEDIEVPGVKGQGRLSNQQHRVRGTHRADRHSQTLGAGALSRLNVLNALFGFLLERNERQRKTLLALEAKSDAGEPVSTARVQRELRQQVELLMKLSAALDRGERQLPEDAPVDEFAEFDGPERWPFTESPLQKIQRQARALRKQ
jgi:hypothetical protein